MAEGFLSGWSRRAYEARDEAEDYGRDARRRAREARDEAEDYGRDLRRRARERGHEARGELRRLWSQLEDVVERNLAVPSREAARAAGDYAREGREAAYDAVDQLRSATRARPLAAIGIAVAATLIITSLIAGSKRR